MNNRIKRYLRGSYHHVYNRGVAKQDIFLDDWDYRSFISKIENLVLEKHHHRAKIVAYCLMPNHFHILLQSKTDRGIENFMRSLCTFYSMYFNKRYDRVGHLFQGVYKANLIETDRELLYVSKYIHNNPKELCENIANYAFSSLKYFSDKYKHTWVDRSEILFLLDKTPKDAIKKYIKYVKDIDEV